VQDIWMICHNHSLLFIFPFHRQKTLIE
jgi:hypothetical protein